jgi:hypothetical protein
MRKRSGLHFSFSASDKVALALFGLLLLLLKHFLRV